MGCSSRISYDWRLTRRADIVYASLLLDNQTLPSTNALELPFVINVSGGACDSKSDSHAV
eukprot:SAG31_NODE_3373_length_4351_cov_2.070790_5_plen_60_part_00